MMSGIKVEPKENVLETYFVGTVESPIHKAIDNFVINTVYS